LETRFCRAFFQACTDGFICRNAPSNHEYFSVGKLVSKSINSLFAAVSEAIRGGALERGCKIINKLVVRLTFKFLDYTPDSGFQAGKGKVTIWPSVQGSG
tara:strand:+ start:1014 stop:1313 length:300 start_codon:yes stop_codon:yes gene_type:complete